MGYLLLYRKNQNLSYEKNAAELHFMRKNSKKCGFFQKSGHNFFSLCFRDFFPAKHLLTYRWATRGSTALKQLRPVRDELRDPKPEKHLSDTHF